MVLNAVIAFRRAAEDADRHGYNELVEPL